MAKHPSLLSFILFFLICQFSTISIHAQEIVNPDGATPVVSQAISHYMERIKDDSYIFEGREYVGWNTKISGNAFFQFNEWQAGNIKYKGKLYQNVPILYDIAADEIVVKHYRDFFKVKLDREIVDYFSLFDHHFINLSAKDVQETPMVTGFYEVLYNGRITLLVKRKKIIKESFENREVHREFIQEDLFFIGKEGAYFPVKSKGSVFKLLKDQKNEIRRYLKKNTIKFRKNPEFAILKMVEFYDQNLSQ